METLGAESEGVVRREAVACICAIYRHQQIPPHCLDLIFSILAHCAVNDHYWEVKVNALDFWNSVMCRQFVHQGMIDGTFPAVTFSKEHKKIITLTDKEIQLRLRKVLNELALRGCLGILLACLKDSDLEVVRKTVAVMEKFMGYLNKYNFIEEYNKSKNGEASSSKIPVIDSNYADFEERNLAHVNGSVVRNNADFSKTLEVSISSNSQEHSDCKPDETIIESIVKDQDINLLSHVYKSNLNVDCNGVKLGLIDENLYKKFASVTADKFLNEVTKINLKTLIDNKSEWLMQSETFSSLLDDVLCSFGHVVDLDCY
jgi:BRCA1-associated ATM activator 1